jgi:hypothetical protein
MPGYIAKILTRFCVARCPRMQHSPHTWTAPSYDAKVKLTPLPNITAPLSKAGKTKLQEIIGTLLYYARAIDSTMLVTLGTLASAQSQGTVATALAITQLLNYCATHYNATVHFYASDMHLHIHSDASYLSKLKARLCPSQWLILSQQQAQVL